jgi:polysaccharide biosynthesis protein PslH
MRILWITFSLQHPALAGSSRHYYFLREICRENEIVLLAPTREKVPEPVRAELSRYTKDLFLFPLYRTGEDRQPQKIVRMIHRRKALHEMRGMCKSLLAGGDFDIVIFHGKEVFSVIDFPISIPIISDFCDATSSLLAEQAGQYRGWRQLFYYLRYVKMHRSEQKLLHKTPYQIFISDRDRHKVSALSKHPSIPNGVDLNYWQSPSQAVPGKNLVFTGVMSYEPNEDAALTLTDEILPGLCRLGQDLHLDIVGKNPSDALRRRASERVHITGFVPDVRFYLNRAIIFVAPLRFAAGIQNKVLEAMAMGIPVITTAAVAEGLRMEQSNEVPLKIADSVQSFIESINDLLNHEIERQRLVRAAKLYVTKYFSWQEGARRLERLCLQAVAANHIKNIPQASRMLTETLLVKNNGV